MISTDVKTDLTKIERPGGCILKNSMSAFKA